MLYFLLAHLVSAGAVILAVRMEKSLRRLSEALAERETRNT